MRQRYANRSEAGRVLADALAPLRRQAPEGSVLILALPRGGVPVGYQIATLLGAPLDVMLVRKLGLPGREELAIGAIASGGACVLNRAIVRRLNISAEVIDAVVQKEEQELMRRERAYRDDRPPPDLAGRSVVLVDDGLATGASMRVAVSAARRADPARIIVAVPVAPPDTLATLRQEAEQVVCPLSPSPFVGVSQWYSDFSQLGDEDVRELLDHAWRESGSPWGRDIVPLRGPGLE